MGGMFSQNNALSSITIGQNWDTTNVTNMFAMFKNCGVLTLNCSSWNVDKVTNYTNFNTNAPGVIAPTWVN